MEELTRKVEAILYSSREPLKVSDIAEYLNSDNSKILKCIRDIERNYSEIDSSLAVGQFGNKYKIKLNDNFNELVSPFIDREFTDKELSMLSYIYKNPGVINGDLREKFGYDYRESTESLKKLKMISSKKYRNTNKYNVTKNFYLKFNINKRTLKKEDEK